MTRPTPALLAAMLVLSACAGSSDAYPSLAIRDVERAAANPAPPPEPEPAPTADPADLARADVLLGEARAAHERFLAALARARQAASAAGGRGDVASPAQGTALVQLATLDSTHTELLEPLAELETLLAEVSLAGLEPGAIASAHAEALALSEQEEASIEGVARQIGR
ncbi:hypothetical protein ACXYN8_10420 [Altererythrobacter sp. CAU 1778]